VTEELATAAQVVARSEEGPDREQLVEDHREEKEHREFEGVETLPLIEPAAHSGCKISTDEHGKSKRMAAKRADPH
jgi:hypothetical protein